VRKPKNMSESDYMKMLATERKKENKSVDESKLRNSSPKSVQGAGNMPLSDAKAAKQVEILKAQNKEKEVKKMNRGGMARKMITEADVPESGPTKPMTGGPQPKKKKRAPMGMDQGSGGAMPRMKKGGKVRGCGMARGGRVCKMVKMKGA